MLQTFRQGGMGQGKTVGQQTMSHDDPLEFVEEIPL